jgi:multiple sugar transport system ATP-binding protein
MTLGDRIAVMKGGVVQQLGTPDDIYDRPANTFVATFIGSPTMNLVRGRQHGGSFEMLGQSLPLAGPAEAALAGQELLLGVRPEHLLLDDASPGVVRSWSSPPGPTPMWWSTPVGTLTLRTVRPGDRVGIAVAPATPTGSMGPAKMASGRTWRPIRRCPAAGPAPRSR